MAGDSFDYLTSNLLCSEAKGLCFDDPENVAMATTDEKDHRSDAKASSSGDRGSDPMVALPCLSEEKFVLMIEEEKNHLPKDDYLQRLSTGDLDMSVRRQALDWILKAHAHYGFGELAFYLAMNYVDRFLSLYQLPGGKIWTVQLLAVACLSLGAKMAEIKVPLVVDLQVGEPKFVFEAKTIRRMELLVLSTLKWRVHSYTPYAYIDYFLKKINNGDQDDDDDDQQQLAFAVLVEKAVKLISSTIKGIDFLEFKPSEVAAAVALVVAGETQAIDVEKAMSRFIQVQKDRVIKCYKLLEDLALMRMKGGNRNTNSMGRNTGSSVGLVPHSPNGVLEAAARLSCENNERTVGSCPNSSNNSPDTQKKKLDNTTPSFGSNNYSQKS